MTARDVANVESSKEMKEILAQKLYDEGTYFTKKHVHINAVAGGFNIYITDYENIVFHMDYAYDDYFGYCVMIDDTSENQCIIFRTSKHMLDIKGAMVELGYYIASRF